MAQQKMHTVMTVDFFEQKPAGKNGQGRVRTKRGVGGMGED